MRGRIGGRGEREGRWGFRVIFFCIFYKLFSLVLLFLFFVVMFILYNIVFI